jgi:hypothetical protein
LATSIAIASVANRLPAQTSEQANHRDVRLVAINGTKAVVRNKKLLWESFEVASDRTEALSEVSPLQKVDINVPCNKEDHH